MYVSVDLAEVPPKLTLEEPDDFKSFKVVLTSTRHSWVDRESLARLSGREGDAQWMSGLDAMISFAQSHGWVDEAGRIRAHVETSDDAFEEASGHGSDPT